MNMKITGKTKLYGIVGHPIENVKSPELFNQHFLNNGIDAAMMPLDVELDDIESFWYGLKKIKNLEGLIVTMPHKKTIVPFLDELSQNSKITRSVNVVKKINEKWTGEMFDGEGCVRALHTHGVKIKNRKIGLVGIGGAGEAVMVALAFAGCSEITISDLDSSKINVALTQMQKNFPGIRVSQLNDDFRDVDIFINCTAIGMNDEDDTVINVNDLPSHAVVFDVITKETPLVAKAKLIGLKAFNGISMHREQAKLAINYLNLPEL